MPRNFPVARPFSDSEIPAPDSLKRRLPVLSAVVVELRELTPGSLGSGRADVEPIGQERKWKLFLRTCGMRFAVC